jgi:GTP pyrophosphokinase
MALIEDVIAAVEQYHPQADVRLIERAYEFSAEAHKEQRRQSGIPYVTHPLEVALILTQLRMDVHTIAGALLHDTIEDTGATEEQIAQEFGSEVAVLVNGVTKLNKLEFGSREEHQAESFRKMVLAMAKDIRVI